MPAFAIGTKNAVGIASRDGLYLDMIGSGGHGGLVFSVMTGFFHTQDYAKINLGVKTKARFNFFIVYPLSRKDYSDIPFFRA